MPLTVIDTRHSGLPFLNILTEKCLILLFDHLLSLSLSFHSRRKTGEVLRILDRGQSINRVFELVLFSVLPALIDIVVAIGIFVWKFDWVLALVIAIVIVGYSE